ncbi:MAG: 5-(carboxyamino)imidazole ribonucleotide synthase [Candidatus Obscuribacterales bacterium]|nr:5-(carboxyamino)imidazole ribonucleotide synthase [Candidatus Obscuribacterales bacterium]
MKTIVPGETIGILGGGQLGRMMALAAQQMGYRVIGFTPEEDSPISQVCAKTTVAPFEDLDAIRLFAHEAKIVTVEFENIPAESYQEVSQITRIAPSVQALYIAQNRLREKTYLVDHGFPTVPFYHVDSAEALEKAIEQIGVPAVLKTSGFGYDGKGQRFVDSAELAREAYKNSFHEVDCIYEKSVKFEKEISVIAARGAYGEMRAFGPIENQHKNHVLDISSVPARVNWRLASEAIEMACAIADSLDIVGLVCVEFFIVDHDRLLINEIAPRPHNSGHYTIEACPTSQFEQHIRAITGMPLGKTEPHSAAAMANLLGELWTGGVPEWSYTLEVPDLHLHLYGKKEARAGRKMGHLTACSRWTEEAQELVLKARDRLSAARIG